MADDVTYQTSTLATPPDATVVATDDVSGAHYQRVKLDLGGDGVSSPLVRGQQADASSIPVTLSTEQAAFIDGLETLLSAIQTATEACQTALEATLTVQGTVTADAGTGPFPVSDNGGALTVDNGGTFAVQVDGNALTALQKIDDPVQVDDAAFTPATSSVSMMGAEFDDSSPDSVDEGDGGAVRMSANRNLYVRIRDNAGNERGLNVDANGEIGIGAIRSALPAGTNAIGKLAANSGVDIGDVDVTSLPALAAGTNAIGKLLPPDIDVTTHANYARKYYTSTGAVTDGIVWSPAAGKRWHVTSLIFQVSADATVTFEDDKSGGDDAVLKGEFKAGSGLALTFDEKYPFASGEDAADLIVTTSAGNIYVAVVGYEV